MLKLIGRFELNKLNAVWALFGAMIEARRTNNTYYLFVFGCAYCLSVCVEATGKSYVLLVLGIFITTSEAASISSCKFLYSRRASNVTAAHYGWNL